MQGQSAIDQLRRNLGVAAIKLCGGGSGADRARPDSECASAGALSPCGL